MIRPFSGWVLGRFKRACNLIDISGRVIALTLPEVGCGPFGIVVPGMTGLFRGLSYRQPAQANQNSLTIGDWQVDLSQAQMWNPQLPDPGRRFSLSPATIKVIAPYTAWPHHGGTPLAECMSKSVQSNAAQLLQVLLQIDRNGQLNEADRLKKAANRLSGLGNGLTPAGDDYLVGVMAALWLTGRQEWLPILAEAAATRTTMLSAAFLTAAGRGEFVEPWHHLGQALFNHNEVALGQAIKEIANLGASSGLDALTGFATTILKLT